MTLSGPLGGRDWPDLMGNFHGDIGAVDRGEAPVRSLADQVHCGAQSCLPSKRRDTHAFAEGHPHSGLYQGGGVRKEEEDQDGERRLRYLISLV